MAETPPEVIYFCETGGKTAPWYRTLGGIKSAFKTSWHGRKGWRYRGGAPPKVYVGTITWHEIDLETGEPITDPHILHGEYKRLGRDPEQD